MGCWSRMRGVNGNMLVIALTGLSLVVPGLLLQPRGADAARDERTLSLYEIHLRETTTVTFKRDGKYLPDGLAKLNHAMRDWRTGATTKMDPKLFDLVWQLHKDLGSKKPVHVISGHRSAKTNAKLRRKGGGQARKSQHVRGRAMDVHFPDIPVSNVRKAAFVHEVGGVGYYPTSALPFVHVDTARVRAWPRMSRSQLAMLFPHGPTKHRPSSGGPLNGKDRKNARIRIAALSRKSRTNTLLANATIPGAGKSYGGRGKIRRPIAVAALSNNGYGTMEIPGLNRHASRLWVNKSGNDQFASLDLKQKIIAPTNKGQSFAKSKRPAPQETVVARLQLASLGTPRKEPARPNHNENLWVNGAGLRASWLTEEQKTTIMQRQPAARQIEQLAAVIPDVRAKPQKPVQYKYEAERVAYAPAFDEEHPDELSYRPFQILPLMSAKPIVQNTSLVAMVEPNYDRIHELIASSENIPMQFRPSSREAEMMWNNQFKGTAILNIRKQAASTHLPTRPQKVARR